MNVHNWRGLLFWFISNNLDIYSTSKVTFETNIDTNSLYNGYNLMRSCAQVPFRRKTHCYKYSHLAITEGIYDVPSRSVHTWWILSNCMDEDTVVHPVTPKILLKKSNHAWWGREFCIDYFTEGWMAIPAYFTNLSNHYELRWLDKLFQ